MAAILCHGLTTACESTCHKVSTTCGPSCGGTTSDTIHQREGSLQNPVDTTTTTKATSKPWYSHGHPFLYCRNSCASCGSYMTTLKHICTHPFGMFVTVTVVSNLPPMLLALTEVGHLDATTSTAYCPASVWLLGNFLVCWVHIMASFYIAVSINHNSKKSRQTVFQRAVQLFLYDPVVAVYILLVLGYIVYLFVPQWWGMLRSNTSSNNNNNSNDDQYQYYDNNSNSNSKNNNQGCTIYVHEKVIATIGFAWAFLAFGFGSLLLSFGFAYVDSSSKKKQKTGHPLASISEQEEDEEETETDDQTQYTTYTSMEEGHYRNHAKTTGMQRVVLNDYVPPMIANHHHLHQKQQDGAVTDGNMTDGGNMTDVMPTTEETTNTRYTSNHNNKNNSTPRTASLNHAIYSTDAASSRDDEGFTTEADTVGFVTDFETDWEDEHLARTSRNKQPPSSPRQQRGRSFTSQQDNNNRQQKHTITTTTVAYYNHEDDDVPMTSYEVQETDTEGGFTTDYDRYCTTTDNDDDDNRRSFVDDTTIDLTDVLGNDDDDSSNTSNDYQPNLDNVLLAIDQDPTVSMAWTGTTDDEDEGILAGSSSVGSTRRQRRNPPGTYSGEESLKSGKANVAEEPLSFVDGGSC